MTLEEVLPSVRQLSAQEKLRLIRILAEELDRNSDIFPFEAEAEYPIWTPLNAFAAAETLGQLLGEHRTRK